MDIQIENLTKSYGPQIAVNNINLSVKTGEILGFLGPNGAGKSTTMKMITGYTGIQYGTIKIGGKMFDLCLSYKYICLIKVKYNDSS